MQYNFYKEKVNAKQQRTAVIISDAFRYESAIELVEVLNKDSKNTTKIESMLASVPSVTSLGMANLLPNTGIEIQGAGFSIDGISTEGTINRTKILKQAKEKSEAIDFNELIKFDQEKGREFFKNNEIVYIYHNQIDSTGEKIKTERKVYDAVLATVDDLALLIRKLNGWNVTER
ncbi:MAG: PglZ domain-containing protein [Bacteroidetes bacterium]|nr:PglZ domain-containing protein [Bacteroidota bacterium]